MEKRYSSSRYSFKSIRRIFLKINRKRMIIQIICGMFLFLLINTFFMVWFSYRSNVFSSYLAEECDWRQDQKLSVYGSNRVSMNPNLTLSMFDEITAKLIEKTNEIIPEIVSDNYSSAMSIKLFQGGYNENPWELCGLDQRIYSILSNGLIEGRMPTLANEVLYCQKSAVESQFGINDSINLHAIYDQYPILYQNFSVVGIISNLDTLFYAEGFSADLPQWQEYAPKLIDHMDFTVNGKFYTSIDALITVINNYSVIHTNIANLIDFNYQSNAIEEKKIDNYINQIEKTHSRWCNTYNFTSNDQINFFQQQFLWNQDLLFFLTTFSYQWIQTTVKVIALAMPLLFLFGLFSLEISSFGKSELNANFSLFKLQGLDYQTIRKVILIENTITFSTSLFSGLFLGIACGFLFVLPMTPKVGFSQYLIGLTEPLIIISNIILASTVFLSGYLIENQLLKRNLVIKSKKYKRKRLEKIRLMFNIQELIFLIPGLLIMVFGIIGLSILKEGSTILDYSYLAYQLNTVLFRATIYVGIIFIAFAVFCFLVRLLTFLWSILGEKIWRNKKNAFSLALHTLTKSGRNFQRVMLIIFLGGVGLMPGLVINTSSNQHIIIEANLMVGCSDIIITDWSQNQTLRNEILSNTEITNSTEVTNFNYYNRENDYRSAKTYSVNILALHNISDFIQTVDFTLLEKDQYTMENIIALSEDMSYLMNKDYAKKHHFDEGVILENSYFSRVSTNYSLSYISSFDCFPLVPITEGLLFQSSIERFSLVTSLLTANLLKNSALETEIIKESKLLLKVKEEVDINSIKKFLSENYNLHAMTQHDLQESINSRYNEFIKYFLITSSIFTTIIILLFGFMTAWNVFQERRRIIEAEYISGAKKTQIVWGFTIELLVLSSLPVILSTVLGVISLNYLGGLLHEQIYKQFVPWLPWWIILLVYCILFLSVCCGWLLNIVPQMRNFKLVKQE